MFTVADSVTNKSNTETTLYPYALVVRDGMPKHQTYWVLHEGFVGAADGIAERPNLRPFQRRRHGPGDVHLDRRLGSESPTNIGWLPSYRRRTSLLTAPIAPPLTAAGNPIRQITAWARMPSNRAAPSASPNGYSPAPRWSNTLRDYEHKLGIERFDLAIDWGWFIVLTQPLFWLLDKIYRYVGNFGFAIILATVFMRVLLFPLANASFKSMSKMKKVQPEMEKLKQRYADDQAKQQQEMMELYKREKVNPMTGCLPMLIQLPDPVLLLQGAVRHHRNVPRAVLGLDQRSVGAGSDLFFEPVRPAALRHTASVARRSSVRSPSCCMSGIWPILMGMTQWVQTKMNPAPTDPVQARMFALMPLIFTFMFAAFPAGLVIYYTWNNMLSMAQQYFMMKREGVPVHLFENMKPPPPLRGRDENSSAAGE